MEEALHAEGGVSLRDTKATIDVLATLIKEEFSGFTVSEVVENGSLGQGTALLDHDIDLVIYSTEVTGEYIIQHGYQSLLEKLKLFIEDNCEEAKEVEIKPAPYSSRPRSVSFTYPFNGGKRGKVDLLVSPHWTGDQTTISKPSVFYRFLTTIPRTKRSMFYHCAAKWQKGFVNHAVKYIVPGKESQDIKEYIKRAKAWRNQTWKPGMNGRPKSYLLTLLVVRAYELASDHSKKPKPGEVTRELVDLVRNTSEPLDIYWADEDDDYYRRRDYPSLLPPRPRVVDPVNPSRNVWATGFDMLNYYPGKRVKGGKSKYLKRLIGELDLSKEYDQ